jgi:Flp pilus assembly pilin Flp
MRRIGEKIQDVICEAQVRTMHGLRRVVTEKDGAVNTLELVAIAVVVIGAVVGISATFSEGVQDVFTALIDKVKELLNL